MYFLRRPMSRMWRRNSEKDTACQRGETPSSVIGLLVIFVLMFRWYMKSENLEDLTGYIDEVSDNTLETVEVER